MWEVPLEFITAANNPAFVINQPSFNVTFDRVLSFAGNGAFVLAGGDGVEKLKDFRRVLGSSLSKIEPGKRMPSSFTPHVTLLYDDRVVVPEQPVELVSWTVREFVLVHSRDQERHRVLARWLLRG